MTRGGSCIVVAAVGAVVALLAAGVLAQPVPLDAVAAVVDRRVITTSEVSGEVRLLLVETAGPDAATAAVVDDKLFARVLDDLVVKELIAFQARKSSTLPVRESDVERALAELRARFGTDADDPAARAEAARVFFARYGIDDEMLRARARRNLAAGGYVQRALLDAERVSEEELDAWLASAAHKGTAPADRATARKLLVEERRTARFNALLTEVRRGVDVRLVWKP